MFGSPVPLTFLWEGYFGIVIYGFFQSHTFLQQTREGKRFWKFLASLSAAGRCARAALDFLEVPTGKRAIRRRSSAAVTAFSSTTTHLWLGNLVRSFLTAWGLSGVHSLVASEGEVGIRSPSLGAPSLPPSVLPFFIDQLGPPSSRSYSCRHVVLGEVRTCTSTSWKWRPFSWP